MKKILIQMPTLVFAFLLNIPVFAQTTVQSLPNGGYEFCERNPPSLGETDHVLCFNFFKKGNRIVGNLGVSQTRDTYICIDGIVNNNTVSGLAVRTELFRDSALERVARYQGSQLREWEFAPSYLRVARSRFISMPEKNVNLVHFQSALLNLNGLSRYGQRKPLSSIANQGCFP